MPILRGILGFRNGGGGSVTISSPILATVQSSAVVATVSETQIVATVSPAFIVAQGG